MRNPSSRGVQPPSYPKCWSLSRFFWGLKNQSCFFFQKSFQQTSAYGRRCSQNLVFPNFWSPKKQNSVEICIHPWLHSWQLSVDLAVAFQRALCVGLATQQSSFHQRRNDPWGSRNSEMASAVVYQWNQHTSDIAWLGHWCSTNCEWMQIELSFTWSSAILPSRAFSSRWFFSSRFGGIF